MIKYSSTLLLTTLFLLLTPSSHAADVDTLAMPGADMIIRANLTKMRDAAIGKEFKALQKLQRELGRGQVDHMAEFNQKIETITGLQEGDFLSLTGAIKLDGLDLEQNKKPDLSALEAVLGIELAKELPPDKLISGLTAYAAKMSEEEKLETPPVITRSEYHGTPIFQGARAERPEEKLFFAMANQNKLFLMGSEPGIKGALDRLKEGEKTNVAEGFPASLTRAVGNHDFSILFKPTPAMQKKMQENARDPQPGPGAMAGQLMAQMKGLGLGVNSAGQMDISLIGDFGSQEIAQQVGMLLDTQVISGIKMFVSMAAGGKALPMLQSLQAGHTPDGTATLKMSIAPEDIQVFQALIEAKANAAPEPDMTPVPPMPPPRP